METASFYPGRARVLCLRPPRKFEPVDLQTHPCLSCERLQLRAARAQYYLATLELFLLQAPRSGIDRDGAFVLLFVRTRACCGRGRVRRK